MESFMIIHAILSNSPLELKEEMLNMLFTIGKEENLPLKIEEQVH